MSGASLGVLGSTWLTLNTGGEDWLGYTAAGTGFGGDVRVRLYDGGRAGVVGFAPLPQLGHRGARCGTA